MSGEDYLERIKERLRSRILEGVTNYAALRREILSLISAFEADLPGNGFGVERLEKVMEFIFKNDYDVTLRWIGGLPQLLDGEPVTKDEDI